MRRDREHAGYRHLRLTELILEEVRSLLRDDTDDPTLSSLRVVALVLSVDYKNARVHYALAANADPDGVARALIRATPYLRAKLGEAIELKRLPDLRFVLDGRDSE